MLSVNSSYCCNHLLNNCKLNFTMLLLCTQFWALAMAYNEFMFERAMYKLRKVSNEAANWCEFMFEKAIIKLRKVSNDTANWLLDPERPKIMWARRAIDSKSKCKSDDVTNNVTESLLVGLERIEKDRSVDGRFDYL